MYSSATDEHPLKNKNMRQVFVRGRIPSLQHGASIRPWTNTSSEIMGQVFVLWTNTFSKDGASIRTVDEYPLKKMEQVFVRGWIAPTRQNGFPEYSSNLRIRIGSGCAMLIHWELEVLVAIPGIYWCTGILPLWKYWVGMRPPALAGDSHPGLSPSCEHRARWPQGATTRMSMT